MSEEKAAAFTGDPEAPVPDADQSRPAFVRNAIQSLSLILALFHIYTGFAGPFYAITQRSFHVGVGMAIIFLMIAPLRRSRTRTAYIIDAAFAAAALAITAYVIFERFRILRNIGYADPNMADIILGYLMIALLIEASRRVVGWEFAVLTVLAFVYGWTGPYLPGILYHQGFSLNYLVTTTFLNPLGIYGQMTAVSATTIAIYVIFGSVLLATGGAAAFLKIALILGGRVRGGSAQVAVIGSGIMGMVNGSAVANTATVGSITIPLMKRQGYPPHLAGAVEAAASSGGQIMPPIMGAGAFVMAEILGVPYLEIAVMAIIPALMYYVIVSASIYFEARKRGFQTLSPEEIPRLRDTGKEILVFLGPIAFLMFLLIQGYTPRYAGFWATASCIGIFLIMRVTEKDGTLVSRLRTGVTKVLEGCRHGAETAATIGIIVAASQIIVAIMGLTGIGVTASQAIFAVSEGSLFLGFAVAAIVNLILGLSLPTVPAYIITVAVVGPALIQMGVEPVVVHMFSFFYACMSGLTPPVAATSFVAAGIARAGVWATSWTSCRLAIAGYIVPLVFAFHPALLGLGTPMEVATAAIFGIIGCLFVAAASSGFWIWRLSLWQSAILVVGGIMLIVPEWPTIAGGIVLCTIALTASTLARASGQVPSAPISSIGRQR